MCDKLYFWVIHFDRSIHLPQDPDFLLVLLILEDLLARDSQVDHAHHLFQPLPFDL